MAEESYISRISVTPTVCHGKPTVRDLGYKVKEIIALMQAEKTDEEILAAYPGLEQEDLLACQEYSDVMNQKGRYVH